MLRSFKLSNSHLYTACGLCAERRLGRLRVLRPSERRQFDLCTCKAAARGPPNKVKKVRHKSRLHRQFGQPPLPSTVRGTSQRRKSIGLCPCTANLDTTRLKAEAKGVLEHVPNEEDQFRFRPRLIGTCTAQLDRDLLATKIVLSLRGHLSPRLLLPVLSFVMQVPMESARSLVISLFW